LRPDGLWMVRSPGYGIIPCFREPLATKAGLPTRMLEQVQRARGNAGNPKSTHQSGNLFARIAAIDPILCRIHKTRYAIADPDNGSCDLGLVPRRLDEDPPSKENCISRAEEPEGFKENYNVAPTTVMPIIRPAGRRATVPYISPNHAATIERMRRSQIEALASAGGSAPLGLVKFWLDRHPVAIPDWVDPLLLPAAGVLALLTVFLWLRPDSPPISPALREIRPSKPGETTVE
jgi:hypothetical protein